MTSLSWYSGSASSCSRSSVVLLILGREAAGSGADPLAIHLCRGPELGQQQSASGKAAECWQRSLMANRRG